MSSPYSTLQDQVAVVTGGGHGIGAGIARRLAGLGASVVIAGRNRQKLEETAGHIRHAGHKCEPFACDVTSLADFERLAGHVERTWGRIDILVNNAGVGASSGPLHLLPPEEWEQVMQTNLRGVYYSIRAFAPMMIKAKCGHIINVSSLASKAPLPNRAAYAASKWGLNGLTYSVAEELRPHHIRVALVCPGSTDSGFGGHESKEASRMLQPDDIAHVIAMLVTQAPRAFASEVLIRPTVKP
ncbi:MAG: SDR family oxidoreductase [Candidatus Korobacteraceae bacterium]|jgi:NAD(P)-dependent dehydrogenase (short-subunit alcohol dehydrogenase family)